LREVSQRSIAGVGRMFSFGSIWETPGTRKLWSEKERAKAQRWKRKRKME